MSNAALSNVTLPAERETQIALQGQRALAAFLATRFETQAIQIFDDRNQASADLQKVLANNPALKGFGGEVTETFNNYNTMLKDAGFLIGKSQIMREIEDVKGDNREAEDVFLVGLTVALADGTIDDKELKVLTDVGMMLGLRIENYLQV